MKRSKFQGQKHRWEDEPIEEGDAMPGTDISRGTLIVGNGGNAGKCLGLSDSGNLVGVKFDHLNSVTEFPVERFSETFRRAT